MPEKPKKRSSARNQHYVPRLLIRNFSFPGKGKSSQVHVFDKTKGSQFKTSIENIFAARDFNTVTDGDNAFCLEDGMADIEGDAADVIRKIVQENSIDSLSAQETAILDTFAALQKVRSVGMRANVAHLDDLLRDHLRQSGTDPDTIPQLSGANHPDMAKRVALELTAGNLGEFAQSFSRKIRVLFAAHPDDAFVIGDAGIVWTNSRDHGAYGTLGLDVAGIEIYMPLSHRLALGYWCPSIFKQMHEHHEAVVAQAKAAQTLSVIGIGSQATSAYRERDTLNRQASRIAEKLSLIANGKPATCSPENMDFFNSMQIRQAERFIIGRHPDFGLAKRMLKEHPDFKTGPRATLG